jgi:hypothetical protein
MEGKSKDMSLDFIPDYPKQRASLCALDAANTENMLEAHPLIIAPSGLLSGGPIYSCPVVTR